MYESREKMRVDEIVDQVVGRSWLQGCPNICAATHFHARSSGRLDVRSLWVSPFVDSSFGTPKCVDIAIANAAKTAAAHTQRGVEYRICINGVEKVVAIPAWTQQCGIFAMPSGIAAIHFCYCIQYVLCWLECIMWWLEWPEICVHYPKSLIRFIKLEYSLDLCRCCEFVVWWSTRAYGMSYYSKG